MRVERLDVLPLLFFLTKVLADGVGCMETTSNSVSSPFQVFRIFPRDWDDVESLSKLRKLAEESRESEIDFWLDSRHPGQFADVMVSPQALPRFQKFMASQNLNHTVTIHDVRRLIYLNEFEPEMLRDSQKQEGQSPTATNFNNFTNKNNKYDESDLEIQSFMHRLKDDGSEQGSGSTASEFDGLGRPLEKVGELRANYPFGVYTNYATMVRYMRTLDFYYPHIVQLVQIGKTHEGRSIGYPAANSTSKRVFWIDGNIHAREWASSHTALFIINQLISGYGKNPEITHYVNKLNFIIVPCANPDGFEYSRSSLNPQIRLWRKNRSPEQCEETEWGGIRCCQGVDLNRNFDFHWAKTGSSLNPCSNLYAGKKAFSEPEAKAVANYLTSKDLVGKVDAFVTLHTYAQMWIHPYSHETQYYPNDVAKIKKVAEEATGRLSHIYGTKYRVGTGADLLAPASGGSDDWAKEKLRVKYVYLVELRPKLELSNGFILKQEELIPTAVETFEGIKVVIEQVLEDNNLSKRPKSPETTIQSPLDTLIRAQSFSTWPTTSTPNSTVAKKESATSLAEHSARSMLKIHPMMFNQLKKEDSAKLVENGHGMHNRLQLGNHVVSKIDLSVSKSIAFARDEMSEAAQARVSVGVSVLTTPTVTKQFSTTTTMTTTPFSSNQTNIKSSSMVTTVKYVSQSSTYLQQMSNETEGLLKTSTTTQMPVESTFSFEPTLSFGRRNITKSFAPLISPTLASVTEIQTTSASTQSTSTNATSLSEQPPTTTDPTNSVQKLLLNEQVQLIRKQILNQPQLSSTLTSQVKGNTAPPSVFTATVDDLSKELVVPTTRSPTRRYALRFLTSAPLVTDKGSIAMKKEAEETNLDSPIKMDIPPLLPLILTQSGSQLANEQNITKKDTEEFMKSSLTQASISLTSNRSQEKCIDKKYSCIFWMKAHQDVCKEQERFMRSNCPFSCRFCTA